jgi:hypothetical protein
MRHRLLAVLFAVLCTCAASASAAGTAEPAFDAADIQADIDVLQHAYETLHPGLYRYNTPQTMRGHFATLRAALDGRRTLTETYLALSEFAAKVRCGHTYANFYNQPESIRSALFEGHNRVPFEFRWLGGRMFVTRDLTGRRLLPRGSEILAINGVEPSHILARLLPIARADGGNDAKRVAQLEVQGDDRYETFDVFLPLYFPQIQTEQRLTLRTPRGAVRTHVVQALSDAQRQSFRRLKPNDPTGGFALRFERNTAVLTMPSWVFYDSDWDWKAFLRRSFEEMERAHATALVIDLRGNEGGVDVGDAILPHLIDAPLTLFDPPRLVRYRRVPDELAPMLDTWDKSFKDWGDDAQPYDARFFRLRDEQHSIGPRRIEPALPRFRGRVFVLIGATNSSATFQFAQQVQVAGVATLVGQTTGGNQRGINGGAFFFLRLPHTRIEMDLPLIARFPDGEPPDAGIAPDIRVTPTPQDIAAGTDVEMAAVRAALRASR